MFPRNLRKSGEMLSCASGPPKICSRAAGQPNVCSRATRTVLPGSLFLLDHVTPIIREACTRLINWAFPTARRKPCADAAINTLWGKQDHQARQGRVWTRAAAAPEWMPGLQAEALIRTTYKTKLQLDKEVGGGLYCEEVFQRHFNMHFKR